MLVLIICHIIDNPQKITEKEGRLLPAMAYPVRIGIACSKKDEK